MAKKARIRRLNRRHRSYRIATRPTDRVYVEVYRYEKYVTVQLAPPKP